MISLDGEVDIATADMFATALDATVTAVLAVGAGGRAVLDLTAVTCLAAHGLSVISAAHAHAPRRSAALVLVVDHAAPAAASLRFLPAGAVPVTYPTLPSALATRA